MNLYLCYSSRDQLKDDAANHRTPHTPRTRRLLQRLSFRPSRPAFRRFGTHCCSARTARGRFFLRAGLPAVPRCAANTVPSARNRSGERWCFLETLAAVMCAQRNPCLIEEAPLQGSFCASRRTGVRKPKRVSGKRFLTWDRGVIASMSRVRWVLSQPERPLWPALPDVFMKLNTDRTAEVCTRAAVLGNLEVLKWARDRGWLCCHSFLPSFGIWLLEPVPFYFLLFLFLAEESQHAVMFLVIFLQLR